MIKEITLLTTSTCTKCKELKPLLRELCSELYIQFGEIDAYTPIGLALIQEYNLTAVPQIFYSDGEKLKRYEGILHIAEIRKFLEDTGR